MDYYIGKQMKFNNFTKFDVEKCKTYLYDVLLEYSICWGYIYIGFFVCSMNYYIGKQMKFNNFTKFDVEKCKTYLYDVLLEYSICWGYVYIYIGFLYVS